MGCFRQPLVCTVFLHQQSFNNLQPTPIIITSDLEVVKMKPTIWPANAYREQTDEFIGSSVLLCSIHYNALRLSDIVGTTIASKPNSIWRRLIKLVGLSP